MPLKDVFKLVIKRVRGASKGSEYTRSFKSLDEMNAARARYAKLGGNAKQQVAEKGSRVRSGAEQVSRPQPSKAEVDSAFDKIVSLVNRSKEGKGELGSLIEKVAEQEKSPKKLMALYNALWNDGKEQIAKKVLAKVDILLKR